jgi:hypothetical protein
MAAVVETDDGAVADPEAFLVTVTTRLATAGASQPRSNAATRDASSRGGPPTSLAQPPNMPLMLPGILALGAVDDQRPRVGRQLVQFNLERVGVIFDEPGQGVPVLLRGHSPTHLLPPGLPTHLRLVHPSKLTKGAQYRNPMIREQGNGV